MPTAHVNGVDLFHAVSGSGEPLVLVHGSWIDHHSWDAVVPALSESFRVVAYDRRGDSASERPAGQGSVPHISVPERYVELVTSFVREGIGATG